MKGFVRKIDKLGRICLPMEFRRRENLQADGKVELIVTDEGLLMRKYEGTDQTAIAMRRLKEAILGDSRIHEKLKDMYLEHLDLIKAEVFGAAGIERGDENDS